MNHHGLHGFVHRLVYGVQTKRHARFLCGPGGCFVTKRTGLKLWIETAAHVLFPITCSSTVALPNVYVSRFTNLLDRQVLDYFLVFLYNSLDRFNPLLADFRHCSHSRVLTLNHLARVAVACFW